MKNTLKIVNKDYDVTEEFQSLIDSLNVNETLNVIEGTYNVRNLFLKSNMTLKINGKVIFNSITLNENFKIIDTRVAGINMPFYAAVLNVIDSSNVNIIGNLIINGNGSYFWEKYWGKDMKSGMRKEYDSKGLRFLCDYDCNRVRNILIQNSKNVLVDGITSKDSGFWNFHILYSNNITVRNVTIDSKSKVAPSTDGIDIDSSSEVLIEKCITYTNDDSICIKSGRDSDGLKTNIASRNIIIRDCIINEGFGITIGSELSGGIENISISNIVYNNTDCGFRIKSGIKRKGYIKNVKFENINMTNVKYPIHIDLLWNTSYSNALIPENTDIKLNKYQLKLLEEVDKNIKNTDISDIFINNINSNIDKTYEGISRTFEIRGFSDNPIRNFNISNSNFKSFEFGRIEHANVIFNNTNINILKEYDKNNDEYDNR